MRTISVRGVSEEGLRWLRARAARNGRSVNSEVLGLLETARAIDLAAAHGDEPVAKTVLLAARLGVRTPSSSAQIIRQDRARATRR